MKQTFLVFTAVFLFASGAYADRFDSGVREADRQACPNTDNVANQINEAIYVARKDAYLRFVDDFNIVGSPSTFIQLTYMPTNPQLDCYGMSYYWLAEWMYQGRPIVQKYYFYYEPYDVD